MIANRRYDPSRVREEFANQRALYETFTKKLEELITDLLKQVHIPIEFIESRTKGIPNFFGKITREDKNYTDPLQEVTDLAGIRIIVKHEKVVPSVLTMLEREFIIDTVNSINKLSSLDVDQFGYLGVHYVVQISSQRKSLSDWMRYGSLKAEVQVRTVCQHAWATLSREIYAQPSSVPADLQRQLNRVSALLEVADAEFGRFIEEVERIRERYKADVRAGKFEVEINGESIDALLADGDTAATLRLIAEQAGIRRAQEILTPKTLLQLKGDLVHISRNSEFRSIGELRQVLKDNQQSISVDIKALRIACSRETENKVLPMSDYGIVILAILFTRGREEALSLVDDLHFSFGTKAEIRKVLRDRAIYPRVAGNS